MAAKLTNSTRATKWHRPKAVEKEDIMEGYIYAVICTYHDGAKNQTELKYFDTKFSSAFERARRWRTSLNKFWTVDLVQLDAVDTIHMEIPE